MRLSISSDEKTRDKNKRRQEGRAKGTRGTSPSTQALLHKMGHPMNWDQIGKNWEEYKPQIKSQWDKLSEHDLIMIHGDRSKLLGQIQQHYSLSNHDAEKQIQQFLIDLNT